MITSKAPLLKARALQSLSGKWDQAIGIFFLYLLIYYGTAFIPGIGNVLGLFLSGPLSLGTSLVALRLSKKQPVSASMLFEGFQHFSTTVSASILIGVYTVLWGLLLIVPGIIAALSYSQTFYLLAEDPTLGAKEAMNKSKEMMEGHKTRFFLLVLSFTGWLILALISAGIGFLWLTPYFHLTLTKFYEERRGENIAGMSSTEGFSDSIDIY